MSTSHLIEREEVMAYLDGELPPDQATIAMAHLERCHECQELAADFRNVSQKLLAWEVEAPSSQFDHEIFATREQSQRKSKGVISGETWRHFITLRRVVPISGWIAACALALLLVSSLTLHRESALKTVTSPGIAADSNGLFHGLGDRAQNSFTVAGQPLTDQQSKVFQGPAAPSTPINGRQFDRLQQFAKLQNAPPVKFADNPISGPMIIRTAGLTLTAKNFDDSRARLDDIIRRHRGYIGDLNVNSPTGSGRSFTATLRVPADQLDSTLAELKKLGRVEAELQNGQDVTSQYVDLEARLANARHTEERLTALLRERTGKLSDVLAVENEISRVRGEIEQMEAERKNLSNQVDFATINATVNENYQAQLQVVPVSTATQIRNAAVEGYRTMVDGLVGVILFVFSYTPTLVLWGLILFFPLRALWRRVVRPRIL